MNLHQALRFSSIVAALALAGCAQPMRRDSPPVDPPAYERSTRGDVESARREQPRATPRQPSKRELPPPAGSEELPVTPAEPEREDTGDMRPTGSLTGVPVCDRYLASFKQCHTTIGQSSPAQVDERYQRLRETLTRNSGTPEGRAQISRDCKGYAASVTSALGDRKCGDPPR